MTQRRGYSRADRGAAGGVAAGHEMTTDAERQIRDRIAERGRVTFAEFMEAALYDPRGGYYTGAGPDADYYTSPAAHPAFGALVAVQLSRMWESLGRPGRYVAVEMGAGSGLLASDVVSYVRRALGPFADALSYVTVDRARPARAADGVRHVAASRMPVAGVVGCVLSNELLDAFPVRRFEMRGGRVLEVYVVVRGGRFVEELDAPSTPELAAHVERLGVELPEGFRGELSTGIAPWMADVAAALERGFVLTIDYGYVREELDSADRGDTVQGYYRHAGGASAYERVGEQDMTAHVDFTHVVEEGRGAGLRLLSLRSQARFLRDMGLEGLLARVRREPMSESPRMANLMAMRELVKPDGLGGFKVLVQAKGDVVVERLNEAGPASEELPLALLTEEHARLLEGRYPHVAWVPDDFGD